MAHVHDDIVGRGDTAPGDESSRPPIQQLGAAPGTPAGVLGLDGFGPEEEEGLEFASSGEAAEAPRFGNDEYDIELSPEEIEHLTNAVI